jgi:hypothetical protein
MELIRQMEIIMNNKTPKAHSEFLKNLKYKNKKNKNIVKSLVSAMMLTIITFGYLEDAKARLNHDIVAALPAVTPGIAGPLMDDFGDDATLAADPGLPAALIDWRLIIGNALAKTYLAGGVVGPAGGPVVAVPQLTAVRTALVNALVYSGGAIPPAPPPPAVFPVIPPAAVGVAGVGNPFAFLYNHMVERRHLWMINGAGVAADNQRFTAWCRAARINCTGRPDIHSAFVIPVAAATTGFLNIINSISQAATNLANISLARNANNANITIDINLNGGVGGGAAVTMMRSNLNFEEAPPLPDVDNIYRIGTATILNGAPWQLPTPAAGALMPPAGVVAPAGVAVPPAVAGALTQAGVQRQLATRAMRNAAMISVPSRRDPIYVEAEAAVVYDHAVSSLAALGAGAPILAQEVAGIPAGAPALFAPPAPAGGAPAPIPLNIMLQAVAAIVAGGIPVAGIGGYTNVQLTTATTNGGGAPAFPAPAAAVAASPGVPVQVARIVITPDGVPLTMYPN